MKRSYPLYDSHEFIMNRERLRVLLRSKTVWGAVAGAVAYLCGVDHIGAREVALAVGPVLAAVGVRDAITRVVAELARR